MHRLRPIIALPLSIGAASVAILVMAASHTLPRWSFDYVTAATTAIALGAFYVAYRIGVAPEPAPNITLRKAVELLAGGEAIEPFLAEDIARSMNQADATIEALVQAAALGSISVWGANIPLPALSIIRSALTKIPSDYWRHHKIDLLEFFKDRDARTLTLSDDDIDSYSDLHFDRKEIHRFKRRLLQGRQSSAHRPLR